MTELHQNRAPNAACDISGDGTGTNYASAEDEPYVTTSPRDPRDAVGIFQQDRWSTGGARGLTATYTHDGRHFTETPLPFSHCAPGGLNYQRASDGRMSTGPDGTVYASGLVLDATDARNGVAASTSYDGGHTWKHTTPLIDDTQAQFSDDKNSVTADPVHPGVAYQVWDRIDEDDSAKVYDGPSYISITRDGGRHWSKARPFVDTSVVPHSQTIGNVIVVDRRTDTLYDVFDWQTYDIDYATGTFTPTDLHFAVVKSTDQGRTWSKPVTVAKDTSVPEVDPNAPTDSTKSLRAGGDLPNVAVDPRTGELYVAYEGSDFSGGTYDSVELTHSVDGGRTWSAAKRVNQVASAPAFTPRSAWTRGALSRSPTTTCATSPPGTPPPCPPLPGWSPSPAARKTAPPSVASPVSSTGSRPPTPEATSSATTKDSQRTPHSPYDRCSSRPTTTHRRTPRTPTAGSSAPAGDSDRSLRPQSQPRRERRRLWEPGRTGSSGDRRSGPTELGRARLRAHVRREVNNPPFFL
ncbi:hypothetical protein BIV25_28710 [Streptomyces sp. MUSC 14]|nr:hypothetical protein BIV25_28710 [Streptomyces sp. MUSC 14]